MTTIYEVLRGSEAFFTGSDYEKSLLESLAMIETKSRSLREEAEKSQIFRFHMCMSASGRVFAHLACLMNTAGT